jgi:predicted dehydrogenase
MKKSDALDTLIIGGGMITNDLILPSIYHLQRLGSVAQIKVCAQSSTRLRALKESLDLKATFPGLDFIAYPDIQEPADKLFPDLYRQVLAEAKPRQAVVVAVPDELHYEIVMAALRANQHVLCVKPLVYTYAQAVEIETLARERGLFVGVEYHKRFDTRALMAKRQYALGHFGAFAMGEARMIEPYYYRHSNFQNWFTTDKTDPFVYVGCHYVDLVHFITGLKPVAVSVSGVKGRFPNGKEGYMWANGRVRYENGALLSVIDGLGYPDDAAGSNDQGLLMYCEGPNRNGLIQHNDQDRGVRHSYLENIGCGGTRYNYVSPDFYRLVPWAGPGYRPAGYGYESISASLEAMRRLEGASVGLDEAAGLVRRRELIHAIDQAGLIATPANSSFNELVVEAARLSIQADGDWCNIVYGDNPHVAMRR